MVADLPSLEQAYDLLCATGEQYPDASDYVTDLGLTYRHPNPRRGTQPILIDQRALAASGAVYTDNTDVWWALHGYDIPAQSITQGKTLLRQLFMDEAPIIGLSGFSSVLPGVTYHIEGEGIKELYRALLSLTQPSTSIDGGVREGTLGLNAVVAAMNGIPTLGCIPYRGLANVGVRTHVLIHGNSYPDRQELVGTLPDMLWCAAGGKGTLSECQYALQNGCGVIVLALRPYETESMADFCQSLPDLVAAVGRGQLIVCKTLDEIAPAVQKMMSTASEWMPWSRNQRLQHLDHILKGI